MLSSKRRTNKTREENKAVAAKMRLLEMRKKRKVEQQSRNRETKNGRRREREGPERISKRRLYSWGTFMRYSDSIISSLRLERETSRAHTRKWP